MSNSANVFEEENDKILKINDCNTKSQNEELEPSTNAESDKKKDEHKLTNTNTNNENSIEESVEFATIIAAHYNSLVNTNCEERNFSSIKYLRNFNNWIKTFLIKDALELFLNGRVRYVNVLDMCCGKGGDIIKWLKSNVRHLICTDIAEGSLEICANRFKDLSRKLRNEFCIQEIIPADCTKVRLRKRYQDPSIQLDIVSCQFSFHYCFESLPQAECMLLNASECLKPGGLFIGTLPNSNEIIKRVRESKTNGFKNNIFSIEMCCEEPYPLFGSRYNFFLEGVVNCPEFLVHFPTLEKLATKYGLRLIHKKTFNEIFKDKKDTCEGKLLLRKMKALQPYHPEDSEKHIENHEENFSHVLDYWEKKNYKGSEHNKCWVGTISKPEWEVITLYQTFIFEKVKTPVPS